ncbi:MAG TPA: DUF4190 domain-containing protein [Propioniciclava tarda]|nr:DUF4190 domain-containing protein [Propioniciclava tarda]
MHTPGDDAFPTPGPSAYGRTPAPQPPQPQPGWAPRPEYAQPEYGAPAPQASGYYPVAQPTQQYPVQQWNAYPSATQVPMGWVGPPPIVAPTNVLAIISLVSALIAIPLLPVILGHLSLGQINRTGEGGRGMAIAGLVLGYLSIAGWFFLLLLVLAVGLSGI